MLALPSHAKIWLHAAPTDMRKSFDGLCGQVLNAGFEVASGDLFVFVNRARGRVKIMALDGDGLAIWYKRLQATGCFDLDDSLTNSLLGHKLDGSLLS